MTNPRIVKAHHDEEAVVVRGHVNETSFTIAVSKQAARGHDRLALEDRLMLEAEGLIHSARGVDFDWVANGFDATEFGSWHKLLTADETATLMG